MIRRPPGSTLTDTLFPSTTLFLTALRTDGMQRPERTRVMVVANQKGGVGKTTTTVNLAAALGQLVQRVLVIDLDPQGTASTALAVDHHRGVPSTYDMLVAGSTLAQVATPRQELAQLTEVPATYDLAGPAIQPVLIVPHTNPLPNENQH